MVKKTGKSNLDSAMDDWNKKYFSEKMHYITYNLDKAKESLPMGGSSPLCYSFNAFVGYLMMFTEEDRKEYAQMYVDYLKLVGILE